MTENSETLNLGSLRLRRQYPIAGTQVSRGQSTEVHPEVAAAARARIAAIHADAGFGGYTGFDGVAPPAPTADLVTDKAALATAAKATRQPLVKGRKLPSMLAPFLTAAGVFLLVLLLFKAPIIISQIQYSMAPKQETPAAAVVPAEVIPAENTISIPKINVHAPVLYEPSIQEAAIQKALESGVVHYGNTAVPGEVGNVAIFGHSSNDWWEPGNYKFVFVLLDKLSPGDQLTVDYQSKRYTYEVTGSRVVEPTEVSVLAPTSTPTLTLITCSPPGTSLKRLVVTAKQISPDPNEAQTARSGDDAQATDNIPSTSTSWSDKFSEAWKGVFSLFGGSPKESSGPTQSEIPAAR